ncbi:squalene/phytoene synthase family protein [Rubellimicrobium aerolatum]|uniref:Squalene/phytoene synthase family protein n=1 Tax=Rubellimicrobium aerolatum TaxID=490979 RepID=A0ABW0S9H5_9RHOB|nr:squalene/phytoene synthase family protein [Rubellimicrobium aerolatum]MBP1804899.1 squalene synthase HpnC [Rubellimicrobium aerolatum]
MSRGENFPVGSLLIRRDLRATVHAFYSFARAADDVADDPHLSTDDKLRRLAWHERGLDGDSDGSPEGRVLAPHPDPARYARQLLAAFRRDARNQPCNTWADLLAYCEDSANPVGRFLLDLHGEGPEARPLSDRLCTALQVLNHLQDLKDDHLRLGRHYLPLDWLAEEGATPDDLAAPRMTPGLRRATDRALDRCATLLDGARDLPGALASRRLAGESATILSLARRLLGHLRRADPLAGRVAPTRADFAHAGLLGAWAALAPRARPAPARREQA